MINLSNKSLFLGERVVKNSSAKETWDWIWYSSLRGLLLDGDIFYLSKEGHGWST